jgi:multiple antibiotic resistance protein
MDKSALIQFIIAMFAILNPIGSVAIFAGLSVGCSPDERNAITIKTSIAIAVILVGSVWFGEHLLTLFGIGIPSLQVAGGLMIAQISFSMLQSRQNAMHQTKDHDDAGADIAVVPLAMPMVAGPGAIVTVIVTTHQHRGLTANLEMSAVCLGLAGAICVCFLSTVFITKVLGSRGMDILTKFMGMLLLAIAVGMFTTGLKGLLPGLAG